VSVLLDVLQKGVLGSLSVLNLQQVSRDWLVAQESLAAIEQGQREIRQVDGVSHHLMAFRSQYPRGLSHLPSRFPELFRLEER
jgi:hypothetical protein